MSLMSGQFVLLKIHNRFNLAIFLFKLTDFVKIMTKFAFMAGVSIFIQAIPDGSKAQVQIFSGLAFVGAGKFHGFFQIGRPLQAF